MLIPILQTAGVFIIAIIGVLLGRKFAKFTRFWALGYIISFLIITVFIAVLYLPDIFGNKFTFMLMLSRIRFVLLCFAVSIGLSNTISRLPNRFEKYAILFLMVLVISWFCLLPFMVPALLAKDYNKIQTYINVNGVCLQSMDYTCGPAAAVTALHKLGIDAKEGELAVKAHTTPLTGTLPWCLLDAINERYGKDGVSCEFKFFNSIDELDTAGITLVILRDSLLVNHCVSVMKITKEKVVLGDPSFGLISMSRAKFEKAWLKAGITVNRNLEQILIKS